MRKLTYLAVLEPSKDGYGVYFPDLLGCISYGKDIEETQQNAKEALELHIYGMEKSNEELPQPSSRLDSNEVAGCIVMAITILPDLIKYEMENKRVRTNVTIPSWLKELAEANQVNFSKLLEISLIEYLGIKSNSKY